MPRRLNFFLSPYLKIIFAFFLWLSFFLVIFFLPPKNNFIVALALFLFTGAVFTSLSLLLKSKIKAALIAAFLFTTLTLRLLSLLSPLIILILTETLVLFFIYLSL